MSVLSVVNRLFPRTARIAPSQLVAPNEHWPSGSLQRVVQHYLAENDPGSALLLAGPWGSGKTFFLSSNKAAFQAKSGRSIVVLSVAGLSTREELDQALFLASAPWLFSGYTQALGVFFKAGLRFAKIDPKDFRFSADFRSGKVAVVLEDVDRFFGDIKVIFGLVVDLVDQAKLHTIIVASEDQLLECGDFGRWKEKVVGTTLRVLPDIPLMVDLFISEVADNCARARLQAHREALVAVARDWGLSNLRIVRYAIKEVSRIASELGPDSSVPAGAECNLLVGLFLGVLEIRRDAKSTEAVARVFSHQGLSESALAQLAGIEVDEEDDDDSAFVARLIRRYPTYEFSSLSGGNAFANFFRFGVVDRDGFISALSPAVRSESRRERFLRNYLDMEQAEFDLEYREIVADLASGAVRSMAELGKIYLALRHLSNRKAIPLDEQSVQSIVLEATARVAPADVLDAEGDDDDFWFLDSRDARLNEIQMALSERRQAALADRTERERVSVFETSDETTLAHRLQSWRTKPLFVGRANEFAAMLGELDPSEIQDVVRLFGARRSLSQFALGFRQEATTLREISATLQSQIPHEGTLSIKQSQLAELIGVIDRFVEDLLAVDGEIPPSRT